MGFPAVGRALRARFGKKLQLAAQPFAATAVGLAIAADPDAHLMIREALTRHFGVWREAEGGRVMVFDVIFPRGTRLPSPDEPSPTVERRYQPTHNVGHFRYLEASHVDGDGLPQGDIAVWDEVWFPFDPALVSNPDLRRVSVVRSDVAASQEIEERYVCTATGTVAVTICNVTAQYERRYAVGRWAPTAVPAVAPARRQRRR